MKRGTLILVILVIAVFVTLVVLFLVGGRKPPNVTPISLEWWGVVDEESNYSDIIAGYRTQHPYVTVTYKKFRMEEYEDALINAWARGAGPDIFSIPNSWIGKFHANDFLVPLPASTVMAYYRVTKPLGLRTEIKINYETIPSLTVADLQNKYVSTVGSDVVIANQIWGIPQSMDTLAMFYNKDLLNFALASQPPTTWNDFIELIPRLTVQDAAGNIVQAGTSLGTYDNIPRAFDILSAIMMQNRTTMADSTGVISFHRESPTDPTLFPGQDALRFYTDFARPTKQVYTWDANQPDALEAFISGKTAFFFGYQYQRDVIASRASKLNWSVAPFPQVDTARPITYANYWVQAVAKRSTHPNEAWNFIQFLSDPAAVPYYLQKAHRTAAIQSLLQDDLVNPDPTVKTFAQQALNARTWYHGRNPGDAEEAFKEMIDTVLTTNEDMRQIMDYAAQRVEKTY